MLLDLLYESKIDAYEIIVIKTIELWFSEVSTFFDATDWHS